MALSKKKLKTATKTADGPVGLTLFFEGTKFIAKLVKRVEGRRYTQVATIIEGAFNDVFGDVDHVSGSTSWSKAVVTADEAEEVSKRLRQFGEVLSVSYGAPGAGRSVAPPLKPARNKNKAAINVLRSAVFGDGTLSMGIDGEIADGEKRINNLAEELRRAQNALEGLKVKRANLLESIRGLGGSTL